MILKTITCGPLAVNNYLVINPDTAEAVLIDAGGDFEQAVKVAKENNAEIKYILNTHGHFDHIMGDYDFQSKLGAKIYLHKEDEFLVNTLKNQLKYYGFPDAEQPKVDIYLEDNQDLKLGGLSFKVIHTPGHSPGAVSLLIEDKLFSGDTLFAESVGRTDLPGGSYDELEKSIKEKLFILDENIVVYPGHGPATTIGHEKKHNPFFKI